jgi:predicted HicB family RNase H-like nuclease
MLPFLLNQLCVCSYLCNSIKDFLEIWKDFSGFCCRAGKYDMETKRRKKVFECNKATYLEAKHKADKEGVMFSRYIERAIKSALAGKSRPTQQDKEKYCLMFLCDADLFARAKTEANREGIKLARWLERELKAYMGHD